jgi:glycogen debranching enzyme
MNEPTAKHLGVKPAPDALPVQFYIAATASLLERRTRVLKHGDTFGVFDRYGDIIPGESSPEGLYHNDTRYLSSLTLLVNGQRPLFLSSKVEDNNAALSVDLTNPDIIDNDLLVLQRDMVHIVRSKFLWGGACFERLGLRNYDATNPRIDLEILFGADFSDIFEVRGNTRPRRGHKEFAAESDRIIISYHGLDGVVRRTTAIFDPAPVKLTNGSALYQLDLAKGGRDSVFFSINCAEGKEQPREAARSFFFNMKRARRELRTLASGAAVIETSNQVFNEVLRQSAADLYMLVTPTQHGPFPYAGVPWFSTIFGRDALITAMQILWIDPSIARGVLKYLAATQATAVKPEADAEPGKIVHEIRRGEMARLGEVPFARYYGSVDGTALFVILAGLYFERTGDLKTIADLWPRVEDALRWIDKYGDRDGDGFVEYFRQDESGLVNQGWKDSSDSIFHADGSLAHGPIALCEVQGYVYAAKRHAARLAAVIGFTAQSARLLREAEELKARFDESFWSDALGFYAIALDGDKRRCEVRSSNAGHLLFSGIASDARGKKVGEQLLSRPFFSGWGVRTIAAGESRYNPMSYHNGSIWPHDNAIIGLGLARYGLKQELQQLFAAQFDAACYMDLRRIPELFCGFQRTRGKGPTLYPVACAPQAWSSAAPFAFIQASLGVEIDYAAECIRFRKPKLPAFLDQLTIRSLAVGDASLDILLRRYDGEVSVSVTKATGPARVEVRL